MSRAIKITGVDELSKKLKQNVQMQDVKNLVKQHTANFQQTAQRNAPVRTGTLKRGIAIRIQDNGMTGIIYDPVEYSPYQEWGTRFMAAHPYFKPAYNIERPLFLSELKSLMK